MAIDSFSNTGVGQVLIRLLCTLVLILSAQACSSAQSESQSSSPVASLITAAQAKLLLDQGATLLDVRSDDEWQQGHLSVAKHLPVGDFAQQARQLEFAKDTPIVLHCRSGGRASRAADILLELGYSKVSVVKPGGYSELLEAGLTPAH